MNEMKEHLLESKKIQEDLEFVQNLEEKPYQFVTCGELIRLLKIFWKSSEKQKEM